MVSGVYVIVRSVLFKLLYSVIPTLINCGQWCLCYCMVSVVHTAVECYSYHNMVSGVCVIVWLVLFILLYSVIPSIIWSVVSVLVYG